LAIAKQVALAKWDNHAPVEDADREAQVIMSAIRDGESKGMNRADVSKFFAAQIEANKVIQYSLLADWLRSGRAPAHTPINLTTTIRPELDLLQNNLVEELIETEAVRRSGTCSADIAKAVGKYFSAHKGEISPLEAIALDRAMAATCTSE
jgi:chorismate mutase